MSKWLILWACLLTSTTAWADVAIESPESGAEVPIPFLIAGRADPGQSLRLLADGKVLLVFRADKDGVFRVPVDVRGTSFAVQSVDGSDSASVELRIGGAAPERSVRREQEAIDARVVEPAPVERLAVPPAVDPNTMLYHSAPVPAARRWNPGGAAATQLTVGTLAGLSGGLLGGVFGYGVLEPAFDTASYPLPGAATFVPLTVGFIAATSFSVWGLGQLFGGNSPWWASVLGGLTGTLAAVVFPPAAIILTPVGATAGYHIARRK